MAVRAIGFVIGFFMRCMEAVLSFYKYYCVLIWVCFG